MRNKQKKTDNNGKKLQICGKAAPVLLTKNWCSFLLFTNQNFGEISVNQVLNNFLLNK
jgi:hypothetical protein